MAKSTACTLTNLRAYRGGADLQAWLDRERAREELRQQACPEPLKPAEQADRPRHGVDHRPVAQAVARPARGRAQPVMLALPLPTRGSTLLASAVPVVRVRRCRPQVLEVVPAPTPENEEETDHE